MRPIRIAGAAASILAMLGAVPASALEGSPPAPTPVMVTKMSDAFVARLEELGISATVVTGPGTHTWPYWERGLREAMPMLLESLDR